MYLVMIETRMDDLPVYFGLEAECREWAGKTLATAMQAEVMAKAVQDNIGRDHAGLVAVGLYRIMADEPGMLHFVEDLLVNPEM